MTFENTQEVINDLEKLFENDEGYDVIIYAGENNVREIHVHSYILSTRSRYFRTLFNQTEKKDGKFILRKSSISAYFFKVILRFIYCGKVDLSNLRGQDILRLLIAVDEINIKPLIRYIQEYLISQHDKFLRQIPMELLETANQYEKFPGLWNYCLEEICAEPNVLFNSNKFISLDASLFELLLKRDDLLLDEIVVWDNLIKWCLAHSNISQDVRQWNEEEITIMKSTIDKFILLIRFNHISSEDFMVKVYPFKRIISEELIDNILMFHMAPKKQLNTDIIRPPRKRAPDSVIIQYQHFAVFASWIKKKNYSYYRIRNIPYNFNLLYRASRDGNASKAFHEKCDKKGATMVIVKLTNSEQIVGGYNPFSWDTINKWRKTYDSFIFSTTNKIHDLESAKVGYGISIETIGCFPSCGPVFGNDLSLYQYNPTNIEWSSKARDYPKVGIPSGHFAVDDYEVFQVLEID